MHCIEKVVQRGHKLAGGHRAAVAFNESPAEECEDERRVVRPQQSPSGMPLPQSVDFVEIHVGYSLEAGRDMLVLARHPCSELGGARKRKSGRFSVCW